MKLFYTILTAALGGRIGREADTIDCPGRCWEKIGGICVPEAGKVNSGTNRSQRYRRRKIVSILKKSLHF